ncbi:hypothetical protein AB0M43_21550 [Longispora sp. NPDC051575]|uniref:hypothetical protein n=1 Tax=Longispora sp. NPDC051575 TaxID=3154943 RepID=UPI00343380DF
MSRLPTAARTGTAFLGMAAFTVSWPGVAFAHGVQGRAETPVPLEVFFYTAAIVVVISFAGLALGWSRPRWDTVGWRPAPAWLSDAVLNRWLIGAARVLVLSAAVFVTAAAGFGSTILNRNIAPVAIFVVWWIGLVPLTLLFGNVWREVNPWATLARWIRAPADRGTYPPRWGLWPAAVLMTVWAWMELVYPTAASPRLLAGLICGYTLLTVAGMVRYGVDVWLDHGEVFAVFTRLLASLSAVEVRTVDGTRRLGFRPPVIGCARLLPQAGQVAFVIALIGAVTFDGLSGTSLWKARDVAATERVISLGVDDFGAGIVVASIGLLVMIALATVAFESASWAADRVGGLGGQMSVGRVAQTFVHSLIPIAAGYHIAHYFTLFVFQSQDLLRLASDPFGTGADLFGTTGSKIDFNLVSPNAIWVVQLAAIVGAHVLGLALAHDRALQLAPHSRRAVASQYPMLALMVLLTVSGLWFLSEGMTQAV